LTRRYTNTTRGPACNSWRQSRRRQSTVRTTPNEQLQTPPSERVQCTLEGTVVRTWYQYALWPTRSAVAQYSLWHHWMLRGVTHHARQDNKLSSSYYCRGLGLMVCCTVVDDWTVDVGVTTSTQMPCTRCHHTRMVQRGQLRRNIDELYETRLRGLRFAIGWVCMEQVFGWRGSGCKHGGSGSERLSWWKAFSWSGGGRR